MASFTPRFGGNPMADVQVLEHAEIRRADGSLYLRLADRRQEAFRITARAAGRDITVIVPVPIDRPWWAARFAGHVADEIADATAKELA
jgi:hypothetical protein